jgi:SAM-dependent methyltransferase
LLAELIPDGIVANIPALAWVPTRSNRRFSTAVRRLDRLLAGLIEGYRTGERDRGDLMSILMQAHDDETGTGMTARQLRDEAVTLVIAGSETTGNTIAWACYLLTRHPDIQAQLQQEADQVLSEALRVLRPGGALLASDSLPSTSLHEFHADDVYNPIDPGGLITQLQTIGYGQVMVEVRDRWIAKAVKPADGE